MKHHPDWFLCAFSAACLIAGVGGAIVGSLNGTAFGA